MPSSSSPFGSVLLFAAFGLLLLMFFRTRRAQRDATTTQSRLGPGVEIMTTSGLYATVVAVDGDVMVLETSAGQHTRWDRRAVARIVTSKDAPVARPGTDAAKEPGEGGATERSGEEQPPPGRE